MPFTSAPPALARRRIVPALVAALPLLLTALAACDSKDTDERCDELERWLDGREASLGYRCLSDDDCAVVWVRPDRPVAANPHSADPVEQRVLSEFQETCGVLPVATSRLTAACVERIIEVVDPANPGQTLQRNLGQTCVLRGDFELPDAGTDAGDGSGDGSGDTSGDAGAETGDDAAACECTNDRACGDRGVCVDCACVPAGLCAEGCRNAFACGAQDDLSLGSSGAACVEGCEAAGTGGTALARCLQASTCDAIESCASARPGR